MFAFTVIAVTNTQRTIIWKEYKGITKKHTGYKCVNALGPYIYRDSRGNEGQEKFRVNKFLVNNNTISCKTNI